MLTIKHVIQLDPKLSAQFDALIVALSNIGTQLARLADTFTQEEVNTDALKDATQAARDHTAALSNAEARDKP